MPTCTCFCLQDAVPRSDATTVDAVHCIEPCDTELDSLYAEEECQDDKEDTCALCYEDDYENAIPIEQEKAAATIATLQLQVGVLRKYKSNYELLCSQLGELNAQIGLQLQRHEADVTALQASIADLQTQKVALEAQLLEVQQALTVQRDVAKQDREYSEHVHRQLSTAAELLKTTEKRLEQQEEHYTAEIERLKSQLVVGNDERAEYQGLVKRLEEELEAFRAREIAAKEQQVLRRQREKSKHKQELMARAVKLRAVSDELEMQRSALRATKKQIATVQADNDALHKQLANVKRDGAHLSNIIDSQRVEHESYADEFLQTKKANKQLAKRVAALTKEAEQLQNELADVKVVVKNGDLENCRNELKRLHTELRQASQPLGNVRHSNDKLIKHVETRQNAENERNTKVMIEGKEQRACRESKYRRELVRMRELLADNQQRATESSKDVQKLRRELLGVQKLLHGCTDDRDITCQPIDRWAEVMQNSEVKSLYS